MPAPRGVPQRELTLDIDENGVSNMSACDKLTGRQTTVTIDLGRLSTDEIDCMVIFVGLRPSFLIVMDAGKDS